MTYRDLHNKLFDIPFKPFRIKLSNSTTYDILEPWMITVGESSAIIVTSTRKGEVGHEVALEWRTVSIAHMVELADIEPSKKSRRSA